MRYLGSKIKLLNFIQRTIEKYNIQGHVFCDLFAGTSCVADFFKDRYDVIANDFMYYSYCFSKAKLNFHDVPLFKTFQEKYNRNVFDWLNDRIYNIDEYSFIHNNYSPFGGRMFFTEDNAIKIGGIRRNIENLYSRKIITENEYYFLIASLLECVTKYSNTSGTYEAFLKFWDNRALKDFILEPIEFKHCTTIGNNICYNEDSNMLLRKIHGDILYIDPPYTVTQYASAYNILETIALCDEPLIKGIGGKRDKGKCVSFYCYKNKAKEELEDLFRQAQFNYIIMSYSNQGVVPLEDVISLAQIFAKDGLVHVENVDYQEYQNHRSSNKRNGKKLQEVLICFEKDVIIRKSPLNYSGSKDTIFRELQCAFPKHIGTFVDVMGGAFNVGSNVYAIDRVIYNDINPYIYNIIMWLITNSRVGVIEAVEDIINTFKLSKADKDAYYRLRETYNKEPSTQLLFVLHMYSFQNYIRFNKKHEFNTPVGVAGYSMDIRNRICDFIPKTAKIEFLNSNFKEIDWNQFSKDTLFYFDPPYYITQAAYNDGKRGFEGWSENDDTMLFELLCNLDKKGYKFILSNVKEHKGRINERLIDWATSNKFDILELGISGWRYAKNEIIVINY